jgi:hypothetical protein
MRKVLSLIVMLPLVLALGCSGPPRPVQAPPVAPAVEQAPVSVAVHYAEALKTHHCTGSEGYIAYSWTFEMGPPSIKMFDSLFAAMFQEVETVESASAAAGKDRLDLELTEFTGCEASWPIFDTTVIEVAYRATLQGADGSRIAQWSGRGRAGPYDDLGDYRMASEADYLNALASVALRKAGADFLVNYDSDPALRRWIEG